LLDGVLVGISSYLARDEAFYSSRNVNRITFHEDDFYLGRLTGRALLSLIPAAQAAALASTLDPRFADRGVDAAHAVGSLTAQRNLV
jgi:hypothetical protein